MKAKILAQTMTMACLFWAWAGEVKSMANSDDDVERAEGKDLFDRYHGEAMTRLEKLGKDGQRRALRLLSDAGSAGDAARKHAKEALARIGANYLVEVHGFGPGWRDLPRVTIGGAS